MGRNLRMGVEYDKLSLVSVTNVATGKTMPLTSAWQGGRCVVPLLTHFGDLSSWEYAQKLRYHLPELQTKGVKVVAVGIGGKAAAEKFAEQNSFPKELLYFDEDASACAALELNPGFGRSSVKAEQANGLSPYLRLLPMLLGIGSPGTLGKVLYGYFGDRSQDLKWIAPQLKMTSTGSFPYVDPSTFDSLGSGYLRPFELATIRLQNMISVLGQWEDLTPDNKDLVVQQGGTVVFNGKDTLYRYDDKGILVYAPIEEVLTAALE